MTVSILSMKPDDWPQVAAIYAAGIAGGSATFETSVPAWDTWNAGHLSQPRLVAVEDGAVIGWAALSPASGRCVYAGVAEVSVYVAETARGRGVGTALLMALIASSEQEGIWTLQAGIFRENTASLAMHRACGFRDVGFRERLGQLAGVWRDVILMERRSPVVGVD